MLNFSLFFFFFLFFCLYFLSFFLKRKRVEQIKLKGGERNEVAVEKKGSISKRKRSEERRKDGEMESMDRLGCSLRFKKM